MLHTRYTESHSLVYAFDPTLSGGVAGHVAVHYHGYGATIAANLDVSGANWTALSTADANCKGPIDSYTWHVHTKWSNKASSAFLSGCGLAIAGNHYDPTLACGPNSEHITAETCKATVAQAGFAYNCTPASYAECDSACEAGDLSGKVGKMAAKAGKIRETWFDPHYPAFDEATAQWNVMLHAVCGKATPRFVCAIATTAKDLPSPTIPTTYAP
ncbi:hypothetical protein SPRG_05498 [Saprolegnia parasitica CBS 223.65]|uniref:Superoxide dismutase copper/zinc binding domain-containing protein n=1 Tax=Saprolegnia parasitica (strain CBS 223.65) TaxID=695850 RepID=A0A067CRV5_SAPPC|nr:hypothetical protein SPRG_05498 [Saprolegnia parasitica CBS 223.65]KDO29542.1 hypothetical protein SPRG_05498 [Saprolegnia parasitica CBS 223.65]|eukprot:XP_012199607.1 hypothetical protein SPRG_05498 [Saprolegnia parasitica CBS 223.65]